MKKHLGKSRVLFLLKHPGKEGENRL